LAQVEALIAQAETSLARRDTARTGEAETRDRLRRELRRRAVTDPGLQTAAYWLIIAAEAFTGASFT
jgi:hypothetical protein